MRSARPCSITRRCAAWRDAVARREGGTAIAGLRAFLALFDDGHGAPADAILAGALRFEAHRLGAVARERAADAAPLGVLFFAPVTWQRDAAGAWQRVALTFATRRWRAQRRRAVRTSAGRRHARTRADAGRIGSRSRGAARRLPAGRLCPGRRRRAERR